MRKTLIFVVLIIFFQNCTVKPPALEDAYIPKIRDEINSIIKELKTAELHDISMNGNIQNYFDLTQEERNKRATKILNGEPTNRIIDSLKLLNQKERELLIDKISKFKEAHISTLKYHNFHTNYCNEDIVVQKWNIKEEYSKELIEYKTYQWTKKEKGIYYSQSYKVISKQNSPKKLEIFTPKPNENISIKMDGIEVKINRKDFFIVEGYNSNYHQQMNKEFLLAIKKCE